MLPKYVYKNTEPALSSSSDILTFYIECIYLYHYFFLLTSFNMLIFDFWVLSILFSISFLKLSEFFAKCQINVFFLINTEI